MRHLVRTLTISLTVVVACTGCAAGSAATDTTTTTKPAAAGSPRTSVPASGGAAETTLPVPDARALCAWALRPDTVIAWAHGTVGQFRSYQYGGPRATVPLKHAFPGVAGSVRGAWCATRPAANAARWWAVLPGERPAVVITVHGPGEGTAHGPVAGPPRVP